MAEKGREKGKGRGILKLQSPAVLYFISLKAVWTNEKEKGAAHTARLFKEVQGKRKRGD